MGYTVARTRATQRGSSAIVFPPVSGHRCGLLTGMRNPLNLLWPLGLGAAKPHRPWTGNSVVPRAALNSFFAVSRPSLCRHGTARGKDDQGATRIAQAILGRFKARMSRKEYNG